MDCQFIMGLFAYVYMLTITSSRVLQPNQILDNISKLSRVDQLFILNQLNNTLSKFSWSRLLFILIVSCNDDDDDDEECTVLDTQHIINEHQ